MSQTPSDDPAQDLVKYLLGFHPPRYQYMKRRGRKSLKNPPPPMQQDRSLQNIEAALRKRARTYGIEDLTWIGAILTRQEGKCGLSGRKLDLQNLAEIHIDHVLPKSRGGSDVPGNLRLVCAEANRAKGDLTDDEFLSLCQDVASNLGKV